MSSLYLCMIKKLLTAVKFNPILSEDYPSLSSFYCENKLENIGSIVLAPFSWSRYIVASARYAWLIEFKKQGEYKKFHETSDLLVLAHLFSSLFRD